MEEQWKTIPGFSVYQVSDRGRIRSTNYKRTGKARILKPALDKGYPKTMIRSDEGRYVTSRVHVWVARAFLGERPDGMQINHIDGNKQNNAPSNLEYCTQSENVLHAYETGLETARRGESNVCAKLTEKDVADIREHAKKHGRLKGRKQLAEKYSVTESHLKDVVSRRRNVWGHIEG